MKHRSSVLLAAVCAVAAFGIVLAGSSQRRLGRQEAPQQARLVKLVQAERADVASLQRTVDQLRSQLAHAEASESRSTVLSRRQAGVLAALADAAGERAVAGPGLVVTLSDAPTVPAGTSQPDAYFVHDTDLQLVVNALLAAGAEAVAVNGNRITALSSIRAAGHTIVVDLTPLVPPYKVTAIGADRARFGSSQIARHFSAWETEFGLGFDVSSAGHLVVPAYVQPAPLTAASPAGSG